MRIVSGNARGIRLVVPEGGEELRPTEDRVKESLFATLGDMTGARVLDLFSGTGALGLEALSRGAAEVVMVERDARHVEAIQENLARVCQAIVARECVPGQVKVLLAEVSSVFEQLVPQDFAFILADPPYHTTTGEYGARELLLDERWRNFCTSRTILALEHAAEVRDLPWAPFSPWRLLRRRTYGIRAIGFAKLVDSEEDIEAEEFV